LGAEKEKKNMSEEIKAGEGLDGGTQTREKPTEDMFTIMPVMQCGGAYQWKAELEYWLRDSREVELSLPGESKTFKFDQHLLTFQYTLKFMCVEDEIEVMDWEFDVVPVDPDKSLLLPEGVKNLLDKIKSLPFMVDMSSHFKGDQTGTEKNEWGTCVKIRIKAKATVTDKFKTQIALPGGGMIGPEFEKDQSFKARANFTVCCCSEEVAVDKQPTCSWKATLREYDAEDHEITSGMDLHWVLNADIGKCGAVKFEKKIPRRVIKYL
jgi:hypothetical protein